MPLTKNKHLFLAASLLSLVASSHAAEYYVNPSGNDRNPGSSSAPWATIAHAASVVTAGATVHVAPGTYSGSINVRNGGTQNARITFISDTPWGAHVVGTSSEAWDIRGDYTTVQGFDISGNYATYFGIVSYASFGLIKGNHVHDVPAPSCGGGGGAGILSYTYTATDNDIVNNVVHDIGTNNCAYVQGIYHANVRGHIQNNIVYRVTGYGIHTWHAAQSVTISNNLSFSNGKSGIIVGDGDSPGGVIADNFVVTNNICMDNHDWGILEHGSVGSHNSYVDNILYRNGAGTIQTEGTASTGTMSQNPLFVNYQADGSGDYHLTAESPGVEKGTWQGAPSFDIDNDTRPQGSAIDIGPYAFLQSSSTQDTSTQNASSSAVVPDGTYTITNVLTQYVVDDPAYSVQSGTQLISWDSNGGLNQKWQLTRQQDGQYTIMNQYSGLYLADAGGKLVEARQDNSASQMWTLKQAEPGKYALVNAATQKAAADPSHSGAQGTGLVTNGLSGQSNQIWNLK